MTSAHNPRPRSGGDAQDGHLDEARGRGDEPQLHLPIDWQALRARLFAAREAQLALDPAASPERLRLRLRGSFDGCAASVLTTYQEASRSVNLDTSSYGKPDEGKLPPVADVTRTGERGQR